MDIDVTRLMETVRILSRKLNIKPPIKEVATFADLFLNSVKSNGRLFELGLTGMFNILTASPFKDAGLGAKLFQRGKISLFPQKIKNRELVRRIFEKVDFFENSETTGPNKSGI
jgi:heterodisulfide reductase subunit C